MVLSSMAVTAFFALVLTPEWAGLVTDLTAWLQHIGVPASVIAVVGVLISEIWKQVLNNRKLERVDMEEKMVGAARAEDLDLY